MSVFQKRKYRINRNRPTIGVTGPDEGGGAAWFFTALSVLLAGGYPVRITPSEPRTADGLQALIIGGGADVDPSVYEKSHVIDEYLKNTLQKPRLNIFQRIWRFISWLYYPLVFFTRKILSRKVSFGLDHNRDHLELQLLDQAVKKDLPVMGICRGAQLMNVYFRGTLYKNLNTFYTEAPNPAGIFPVKKVFLKPGSKLADVLKINKTRVNALHNQAVKEPGKGIEVVAWEPNKVVQAIEHTTMDYMIGVQWHPEFLPHNSIHRKLFQELIKQAKEVNQQIEDQDMQAALSQPKAEALEQIEEQSERAQLLKGETNPNS